MALPESILSKALQMAKDFLDENMPYSPIIDYMPLEPFMEGDKVIAMPYNAPKDFAYYYAINEDGDLEFRSTSTEYHVANGASKAVLVASEPNFGYVIKIPMRGSYYCDNDVLLDFYAAPTSSGWDYCKVEEEIFQHARRCFIDQLFAETQSIGNVNGHPIYAQEFVTPWSTIQDALKPILVSKETRDIVSNHGRDAIDTRFAEKISSFYGPEVLKGFCDFCGDCAINDLHNGNIGLIGDRPVVFDYSGFYE